MSQEISHAGVIDSIEGRCVRVRIVQTAACAGCKVADHCRSVSPLGSSKNTSEAKEKVISVTCDFAASYHVGQEVVVSVSHSVANKALLLGFGLPLLLLVTVLIAVLRLTGNEGVAALSALGALVPYYIIVWLARDRIQRQVAFKLEQINK